jgi:hypothetical protein
MPWVVQAFTLGQSSSKGYSHADASGVVTDAAGLGPPFFVRPRKPFLSKVTDVNFGVGLGEATIAARAAPRLGLHTNVRTERTRDARPTWREEGEHERSLERKANRKG